MIELYAGMSAIGTKRTYQVALHMSAFGVKRTSVCQRSRDGATKLAFINRVAAAGSTIIAAHSFEQPGHSLAALTNQPRPRPAEIAPCPYNPNVLRHKLVAQFNVNHELRRAHFFNTRPSETRIWEISPTALECAHPVQFAYI